MRARRLLVSALTGAAGGGIGLALARTRSRTGPLAVQAGLDVHRGGGTRIDLGVLGTADAPTHRGPLRLRLRAEALDPDSVAALADAGELARARTGAPDELRRLVRRAVAGSAAAAVGSAAALTAAATGSPADAALGAGLATIALAAATARAATTVDRDAWQRLTLDGLLRYAPKLLGDLRTAPQRIDLYRAQLVELLQTATDVRRAVVRLPQGPDEDAVRLVHVSDIHLSPFALPLATVLAKDYEAAAILDTGDLVDWGTPAEEHFVTEIAKLPVPYIYVKGNHDSPGIAAAVARQPNATALDGGTAQIAGLTVAGVADPRFTADKTTGDDDDGMPKVAAAARKLAALLAREAVDIALVHSPDAGRALAGRVPLVLAGDTHRRKAYRLGTTTMLVLGSSGGAGLRGVQEHPPVPVTLSVLHVDRRTRTLQAVDEVTLAGVGGTEVRIVRRQAAELAQAG